MGPTALPTRHTDPRASDPRRPRGTARYPFVRLPTPVHPLCATMVARLHTYARARRPAVDIKNLQGFFCETCDWVMCEDGTPPEQLLVDPCRFPLRRPVDSPTAGPLSPRRPPASSVREPPRAPPRRATWSSCATARRATSCGAPWRRAPSARATGVGSRPPRPTTG